ncbi:MAG: NTP transferase domain-containing protein [Solobacterium sp.]|nr:NTP transferase domain-containing protein [Solobacterium sp.]
MRTGAVITAAGMSSRMGDFKPMLSIGGISIAERVIATLQQSGATEIVMVTGFNAEVLEHHLASRGVVFLRNEQYENTTMFDSACLGLSYIRDKCDRVLFTPVDIPLFTSSTVRRLMESDADVAVPVCDGKPGHPTLISCALIGSILADPGNDGLRGALQRCGAETVRIPVEDKGILHDADTPEDYADLLRYHNMQLVRPVVDVSLVKEKPFFDSRLAMLFRQVEETGSVRSACKRVQMSYSSCWNVIRTLESQLQRPLIERNQGGAGKRRSHLTADGKKLLTLYEEYSAALRDDARRLYDEYFREFFSSAENET